MSDDTLTAAPTSPHGVAAPEQRDTLPARGASFVLRHHTYLLRGARWGAVTVWAFLFGYQCYTVGIPYWRSDLLLWLACGLLAASFGKRNLLTVVVDFVPFAAVLVGYDYLRGVADTLGMPAWWHPQLDVDKAMFFGTEPTVWLQAHLRYPDVRWWDVLVGLCYVSFFFLPYVTAAVLWLRSRADFYRWSLRFVALSFLGFAFFALTPAAPPWAAANCTAAQIADHPANPPCMWGSGRPDGGLLGAMFANRPGTPPWITRGVSIRGLGELHLHWAQQVVNAGQIRDDAIAAVPSLHAGGILLFTIFMWNRLNKWWRPLLVGYPLFMAFTLVYGGEHYVADVLAGWLAAILVCLAANRIERWRDRKRHPDSLEPSSGPTLENACPPTATMPSST